MLSVINYCIKIWGTTNNYQKKRVQKLQNFAARVAAGRLMCQEHGHSIRSTLETCTKGDLLWSMYRVLALYSEGGQGDAPCMILNPGKIGKVCFTISKVSTLI